MNYTACIQPMGTYLKVTVSGTMESLEDLTDFADLLRKLSDEYGLNWALLDERRLRKHFDILDAYNLAEADITAEAAARGVRMACLPHPEDLEFARNIETIMHNRSISYRVFTDQKDAEAWLTR
ncbi:hypothetical protein BerOc1_02248 [Pseudodesulfovibrio hydrargyri]|uniref:STAS/SEC14 domain-containing protein n=1 Tax=Pseudodesulfovibrio hydrargyri TaxID=2125990 RepID=A0A1J5MUM2_9BACT|nr:hypothetical protein [Pseudodesulfovibrio hydrargyri]OIQ50317.1 hypothetical protein BerOc1_02248 [Pseudodesulfovibrio hydrargyri]